LELSSERACFCRWRAVPNPGDECAENGENEVPLRSLILWIAAAACAAAAGPPSIQGPPPWERRGRALFLACEFKPAARAFEKALKEEPARADLHYWLGKSYARLAEVSGPLSASRNARKARRSLEQAVSMEPRNDEYLRELFEFYLDSPEWFGGGLERAAALLERIRPGASGADALRKQLADSRREHSGAVWWMERAVLWTSGTMGRFVPQP
jgi:tetratricopeptide (TPR) repeat protein